MGGGGREEEYIYIWNEQRKSQIDKLILQWLTN